MKFGAVREANSLSALMIARDDHDSALSAAPKPRHHLQGFFKKIIEYQNDIERRGMTHNHPSGDPRPSADDIVATRAVARLLDAIEVSLVDHLVLTSHGCTSLRAERLL